MKSINGGILGVSNMSGSCQHGEVRKQGDRFVCAQCGGDPDLPGPTASAVAWRMDPQDWLHLGVGGVIALILFLFGGFPGMVLSILKTLVHETGHAAAGWLVGRPSMPRFDFQYGGGFTTICGQSPFLIAVWGLVWVGILIQFRDRRWWPWAWGLLGLQALLTFTGLNEPFFVVAGHLGELIFAGIFLFRAATGMAVVQQGEAWLYSILGWGIWIQSIYLAWAVLYDAEIREFYLQGKRGVDNDLVQLAENLPGQLSGACVLHLLAGAATIALMLFLAGRWKARAEE